MGGNRYGLRTDRLWPDASAEAKRRHEEQQIAAERGLWALADLYMPNDIREAGERWKLPHVLQEQWRAAFVAGWRAATAAGLRAAADTAPPEGAGPVKAEG